MRKKVLLYMVLTILLFSPALVWGSGPWRTQTTYEQTADGDALVSGEGAVCAVHVITDGTNDATVILYDTATAAAGAAATKLAEIKVIGADNYGGKVWVHPVNFETGLSADVEGDGASYIIEYIEGP